MSEKPIKKSNRKRKSNRKMNLLFAGLILLGVVCIGLLVAQVVKNQDAKPEEKKEKPVHKAEDLVIKWEKVDTAELKSLIEGVESIDKKMYTKASMKKVNVVLKEAKSVIQKKNVTQEEVGDAYVKLARSLQHLKPVATNIKNEDNPQKEDSK